MGVPLLHQSRPTRAALTTFDSSKLPSFKNMTEKDLAVNFNLDATLTSDTPMFALLRPALEKQTKAALHDETSRKSFTCAADSVV